MEFATGPAPEEGTESARSTGETSEEEERLDDLTVGELETMLDAKLAEIEGEVD